MHVKKIPLQTLRKLICDDCILHIATSFGGLLDETFEVCETCGAKVNDWSEKNEKEHRKTLETTN